MSKSDRKSLLVHRAAALGLLSVTSLLSSRTSIPLMPIPHSSNSRAVPILTNPERTKLAEDLRAYHSRCDAAAWEAGKAGNRWLLVIA